MHKGMNADRLRWADRNENCDYGKDTQRLNKHIVGMCCCEWSERMEKQTDTFRVRFYKRLSR